MIYRFYKMAENKNTTINPKNNDDKCFQYATKVTLNHEQIKSHPERISNIKHFIDQYNWKERNFPSNKKDYNEFEKNNKAIPLNVLYVPHNTEKIRHAYKPKYELKLKIQIIILIITDGEKWHYLTIKNHR